jgi:hypothetical protein
MFYASKLMPPNLAQLLETHPEILFSTSAYDLNATSCGGAEMVPVRFAEQHRSRGIETQRQKRRNVW